VATKVGSSTTQALAFVLTLGTDSVLGTFGIAFKLLNDR